jgi:hypothetical protein
MKTLTAAAEQARSRSWVAVRYRLTLTLWRDRYGAAPVSFTTRWADRDELTPATVQPRPVEDRWLRAGPSLGPDWVVPATGGPWDAFRLGPRGEVRLGDPTRRALVRYAPWTPPTGQALTTTVRIPCGPGLGAAETGVALRLSDAANGYLITAGTSHAETPALAIRTLAAGVVSAPAWMRTDVAWEPGDRLQAQAETVGAADVLTIRRNDVVVGQWTAPGVLTGGLGLTAWSPTDPHWTALGPVTGGALAAPPAATAIAWQGLVLAWDGIEDALAPTNPAISIGHLGLVLDNTRPVDGTPGGPVARISDLFRIGTNTSGYDLGTSEALLEVAFEGHDPATEAVRLFRLMLDDVEDVSEDTVTLNCSGVELAYEDWDTLLRITTDRFPDAAPEAVGQVIPLLCGDLHRARLHFVQAGMIDRLRVAVPIDQTAPFWMQVSEPEKVRKLPVPGELQIDGEVFAYDTTRPYGTAEEIATIHISARAQRSTNPVAHGAGAEVRALNAGGETGEYVGVLGENRPGLTPQSWTQVYSDGMAKDAASPPAHTVELANTTLWPGKSLTVVRFASTAVTGPVPLIPVDWGFARVPMGGSVPTEWAREINVPHIQLPGSPYVPAILLGHAWPETEGGASGSVGPCTCVPLVRYAIGGGVPGPGPGYGLMWYELTTPVAFFWRYTYRGPAEHMNYHLDELEWDTVLSLSAATAPIRRTKTPAGGLTPGLHSLSITEFVEDAIAAGRTMITFRWRLYDFSAMAYEPGAGPGAICMRDMYDYLSLQGYGYAP